MSDNFFDFHSFCSCIVKIKSAATEVTAPKNANSDCRQTNFKQSKDFRHTIILTEFAILPNPQNYCMRKKGIIIPKDKNIPTFA